MGKVRAGAGESSVALSEEFCCQEIYRRKIRFRNYGRTLSLPVELGDYEYYLEEQLGELALQNFFVVIAVLDESRELGATERRREELFANVAEEYSYLFLEVLYL